MRYNLDLGITKDTRFTERIGAQLFVQVFNILNHMRRSWREPLDPANFGIPEGGNGGQYNALTLGGSGAAANYTRIFQVRLRVYF